MKGLLRRTKLQYFEQALLRMAYMYAQKLGTYVLHVSGRALHT